MLFNKFTYKKKLFIFIFITIILWLLSSIYLTFNMDEEFTISLVKHSYFNIIKIDQLDVHPPLYYLILKFFLQITTFWTRSLFIKVIFSRLFSIFIGMILFYFLNKILKIGKININWKFQCLLYLYINSILPYLTTIRMYELATLFIVIEFYNLLLSFYKYKNCYFIIAVIFASLASYTHYFAAISSGLFIFLFFINSLLHKKNIKSFKYLLSGLLFIILYIPIVPFVLVQIGYETSGNKTHSNISIFLSHTLDSFIGINNHLGSLKKLYLIIISLSFIILIIYTYKHLNLYFNFILTISLINYGCTIFIAFILTILKHIPFESRYTYPIFSIYSFLLVSSFIIFVKNYINNSNKQNSFNFNIILVLISFLFLFNAYKSIYKNIKMFDIPSVHLMNNLQSYKKDNKTSIYVNNKQKYPTTFGKPLYVVQQSIYLNSIHKRAIIKSNKNNMKYIRTNLLAHNNKKLFNDLFNNIKVIRHY